MDNSGWNMYVFRDGRRILSGQRLTDALIGTLKALNFSNEENALATLVAASELECALKDSEHPQANLAEQITNGIAEGLVRQTWADSPAATFDPRRLEQLAVQIRVDGELSISVLEGFAYYALHPRKILRLLDSLNFAAQAKHACMGHQIAVVGIRSIGAPLSAVLAAALRLRGLRAERITVRPTGHPYDRVLTLDPREHEWVSAHASCEFVLIDEGPGLSGSSFLATAEALSAAGIATKRIRMIGSRQPDPSQLRATNAVERWAQYRFHCLQSEPIMPDDAVIPIGAGLWRREFLTSFENQPASWTALEMAKFLSYDRTRVYKFEGFGHFGRAIAERVRLLHATGFTIDHQGNDCGFGRYEFQCGCMLSPNDLSTTLIHRMANYCAIRAKEVRGDNTQPSQLNEMMHWNWQTEFGGEFPSHVGDLAVEFPTVCDARMAPHEWFQVDRSSVSCAPCGSRAPVRAVASGNIGSEPAPPDGRVLKLDCGSHGDAHFFPGPCDIAWDLAGAIVEWKMAPPAREVFIAHYEQENGDRVRSRLGAYELAYAVFRMAWSKMAAEANAGQFDEQLLRRDYLRYREQALELAAKPARKQEAVSSVLPCALPESSAA